MYLVEEHTSKVFMVLRVCSTFRCMRARGTPWGPTRSCTPTLTVHEMGCEVQLHANPCRCRWCAQGSVPWAPINVDVPRTDLPANLWEPAWTYMIIPRVVTLFDPLWWCLPSERFLSLAPCTGQNLFDSLLQDHCFSSRVQKSSEICSLT